MFRVAPVFFSVLLGAMLSSSLSLRAEPSIDPDFAPGPEAQPAQKAVPTAPSAAPAAATPDPSSPAPTANTAAAPAPELIGTLIRKRVAAVAKNEGSDAHAITAFYLARKDEPVWTSETALLPKGQAAMEELARADDWGLDSKNYTLPKLPATFNKEEAAKVELDLMMAVLAYARDARGARIEMPAKQLSSYLDRKPQLLDPAVVLDTLAKADDAAAALKGFHPKHPQFEKLRQKYLEALKPAAPSPDQIILPPGPLLNPGQKNKDVVMLRRRLSVPLPAATAPATTDETLYDSALADAVKAFQTKKGLRADGVVGGMTREALNDVDRPNPMRLKANMEMWRWIPDDLGAQHIEVNVPEFMFRVIRDGAIFHEERVVTGLVDKQTPVFSAAMELVTLHPYWHVPESIKVRELYPSLARGGSYFQKQGLQMLYDGKPVDPQSVNWGSADIRKYDIRQPPGSSNVLGLVKFSFPNKHTVYMHDTSSRDLFNETTRAFSHGCMRVRDPIRLAEIILESDKGWDKDKVRSLVAGPAVENQIRLDKKIPVHVMYFTSWIADDGTEKVFKDIYGHEKRVTLALQGRFSEINVGPDHLAPVKVDPRIAENSDPLGNFFTNLFGNGF